MSRLLRILIAIVASYAAALAALLFSAPRAYPWYDELIKPALVPPEWSFVPLWLTLYALTALALAIVWTTDPASAEPEGWARFYFIQLLFSGGWVFFFFGLHAVLVAFVCMLFLAFIVSSLIAGAWEIDRRASYLLAPYFAFTLFIAYLNLNIWFLN
ncbi:tryptophan-rich sensory protein [Candidatus Kaiserbacteria bacterium]|nr:tryptophan-rich sensory protein [Candidatus Kaiserbacteria bacterium]